VIQNRQDLEKPAVQGVIGVITGPIIGLAIGQEL
jgi:hypothetical protein